MRKILILASNPNRDLALDREIRDLEGVIKRSKNRDEFEVRVGSAVRPEDLQELLLDCEPQIVHFCGHGTGEQGLVLQNSAGREQLVSTSALSSLFKLFTGKVECVLLNACYSEVQANAISQHINYVIGMSQTILDDAAIAFATGFYRGLGYGRTTDESYHFGCNAIELMPSTAVISRSPTAPQERKLTAEFTVIPGAPIAVPEHLKPILKTRETLAAQPHGANVPAVPTSETKRVEIAQDVSNALEQEAALKQYRNCVRDFLADSVLTPEEKLRLGQLAKQLGIDPAEAVEIFQEEEQLRFASAPPGQVTVATDSPIQPLFASETVVPARSQPKQRSLLIGGIGAMLGLGIVFLGFQLFARKEVHDPALPLPSESPIVNVDESAKLLETAKQQAEKAIYNLDNHPERADDNLNKLAGAIAILVKITPDQSSYGESTVLAQDWYSKLLVSLKGTYGVCEVGKAIEKLKKIPHESIVYSRTDIDEWQVSRNHFDKLVLDLTQNNIDAYATEIDKVADYCKVDIVRELLKVNKVPDAKTIAEKIQNTDEKEKARKAIAEYVPPSPSPTLSPSPSPTLSPSPSPTTGDVERSIFPKPQ